MNNLFENLFLEELNSSLFDLENRIESSIEIEEYPNLFIVGLPRSGTTYLSQLLFNCMDIGTTNNLIARFWESPLVGAMLSQKIFGDKKAFEYSSEYGRTQDIMSPHEFSYFWRKHLLYINPYNFNPKEVESKIDWDLIYRKISGIGTILSKPLVLKTLEYTSFFQKQFHITFPKSFFVYITRNNLEIAKSIYLARKKNTKIDNWWSSVPLEFDLISNLPFYEQIAGQIFYLKQLIEESLKSVDKANIIEIDYSDLLSEPEKILYEISGRVKKITKHEIKVIFDPKKSSKKANDFDFKIEQLLIKGLRKFDLFY